MKRGSTRTFSLTAIFGLVGFSGVAAAQDVDVVESDEIIESSDVVSEPPGAADPPMALSIEVTESELLAPQPDVLRLGAWMEYTANVASRERRFGGASQIVMGGVLGAISIAGFLRTNPTTELDKGLALATVLASGSFIGVGIFNLAKRSTSELRLRRWEEAQASGMTPSEFARFEGELRSQSETADRPIRRARWGSFALAMTGGLVLGLTPVANLSSDGETLAYIIGGVTVGFGLLNFGLSFIGTPATDYWSMYQQGQGPKPRGRKWSAAPAVGHKFYGARVVGRF